MPAPPRKSALSILEPRCTVTRNSDRWPYVARCDNRGDLTQVGDEKMCAAHVAERAAAMDKHPAGSFPTPVTTCPGTMEPWHLHGVACPLGCDGLRCSYCHYMVVDHKRANGHREDYWQKVDQREPSDA